MRPYHGAVMIRVMGGGACVTGTGGRSKRRPYDEGVEVHRLAGGVLNPWCAIRTYSG